MKNRLFNSIRVKRPGTNSFDLSHERKMSCNMSDLIPIYHQEIVPGDKFRVSSEIFLRMAPMLAPIMHRVDVYTHYFFVPNRLTWTEWGDFITGGEDGTATPTLPRVVYNDTSKSLFTKGSLADYFGIPTNNGETITAGVYLNALPFRAYQMIFNEYYRDQNLVTKVPFSVTSDLPTQDETELLTMRNRAWEKDYFTSALPWAQKGAEVQLPIDFNYKDASDIKIAGSGLPAANISPLETDSGAELYDGVNKLRVENLEEDGVSVTINELRQSVRLQEWLEKNARGGSRLTESILAHFGIKSSDARLQRPEYLGGGKQPVTISETLSTVADTTPGTEVPQGNMAGHGVSVGRTNKFTKRFEEHGYVIGIMSIIPRTTYQQGIAKMWIKTDKTQWFWPEFANLGEQEIENQEIYFDKSNAQAPRGTWGYQSRYAEYKFAESSVHSDFRESLQYWHMGRYFDQAPLLNGSFVTSDPTDRIFAVTDETEDKLYVQIFNKVHAQRPMPIYGTPML